jgi:hypothetical protein
MELKSKLLITSLVIFISSCAVGPSDKYGRDKLATEDGRVCIKEKVVGSQIPKRVCGTPEEMAMLQKKSEELMRRMHRKPNSQGNN